jgi:hypothetical protein
MIIHLYNFVSYTHFILDELKSGMTEFQINFVRILIQNLITFFYETKIYYISHPCI